MLTSTYYAGQSFLHTTRPLFKVLALFLVCTLLFVFDTWFVLTPICLAVFGLYGIAGIPRSEILLALRPAFWMLLFIFIVQIYFESLQLASFVILRFVTMILAASLLTLTTKTSDLIAALEQFFNRFLPEHIAETISLAFSLCFRFIPLVRQTFDEVTEAQKARGHHKDWRALATPTIIRTLKSADEISQAIIARSVETSHLSAANERRDREHS
jgi:biotin transport system permease protein